MLLKRKDKALKLDVEGVEYRIAERLPSLQEEARRVHARVEALGINDIDWDWD